MPAIPAAAFVKIRSEILFIPAISTTEYITAMPLAPTSGRVSPEARVETMNLGTPTGSSRIARDIAMMYSVVDIAGINRISERILTNAAAGIAGMARAYEGFRPAPGGKPLIGATMFGVTTPCVTAARHRLEGKDYEALVFHATGTGGQSLEALG